MRVLGVLFSIALLTTIGCGSEDPIETDITTMTLSGGSFWEGYEGHSLDLSTHELKWFRDNGGRPANPRGMLIANSSHERALIEKAHSLTVVGVRAEEAPCWADGAETALKLTRQPDGRKEVYIPEGNQYVCVTGAFYVPPAQLEEILEEFLRIENP